MAEKKGGRSWHKGLRNHVVALVKKGNVKHMRAVSALLLKMHTELDEASDSVQTHLLEAHPYMPATYFAQCLGVPYTMGLALYKRWHTHWNKPIPRQGRTDVGERKQWEEIVAQELLRKNK